MIYVRGICPWIHAAVAVGKTRYAVTVTVDTASKTQLSQTDTLSRTTAMAMETVYSLL